MQKKQWREKISSKNKEFEERIERLKADLLDEFPPEQRKFRNQLIENRLVELELAYAEQALKNSKFLEKPFSFYFQNLKVALFLGLFFIMLGLVGAWLNVISTQQILTRVERIEASQPKVQTYDFVADHMGWLRPIKGRLVDTEEERKRTYEAVKGGFIANTHNLDILNDQEFFIWSTENLGMNIQPMNIFSTIEIERLETLSEEISVPDVRISFLEPYALDFIMYGGELALIENNPEIFNSKNVTLDGHVVRMNNGDLYGGGADFSREVFYRILPMKEALLLLQQGKSPPADLDF